MCLAVAASCRLDAQASSIGLAPPSARALVVRIASSFTGDTPDLGAGIVVGADSKGVYIATARHVVRKGPRWASRVVVTFASGGGAASVYGDTAVAAVLRLTTTLDLAVVTVAVANWPSTARDAFQRSSDRLGDVGALRRNAAVVAVGCPGECWGAASTPDLFQGRIADSLRVDAGPNSFMDNGSSGGAVFNENWEVVGLMSLLSKSPRFGTAIPIDAVIEQLDRWGVPVQLTRPSIPRQGYRWLIAFSLLSPSGTGQHPVDRDRLPSGRVSVMQRLRGGWSVAASAYRFAPKDIGVSAAMLGVSHAWPLDRYTARPFVELGFGRVEGRFDAGGVTVKGPPPAYVPRWEARAQNGIGFGAGVEVQRVLMPRVVAGALIGRWSFPFPAEVPQPARVFYGLSLHYGVGS